MARPGVAPRLVRVLASGLTVPRCRAFVNGGPVVGTRRAEGRSVGVTDSGLVGRLRSISGDEHVLTDRHELRTYESDGLRHYRTPPAIAVLP